MQIKSLKETSYNELLKSFNLAFSDYFIPIKVGIEQFTTKLESHNIDLSLSVGTFRNDELVGFVLHGTINNSENRLLYNLGTGVIPTERGNKLTYRMYEHIIPIISNSDYDKITLEVITKNKAAIKSYQHSGFEISNHLFCYKGMPSISKYNFSFEYKAITNIAWEAVQSFWTTKPTIQNSAEIVNNRLNELRIIGAFNHSELIGYIIYNPKENSIMQLAVHPKHRRKKIGSTLIGQLRIDSEVRVLNVNKTCVITNAFFKSIGFNVFVEQYEMLLEL